MWQFGWIISLIPDAVLNWVYWLIIVVGLTGIAAGWLGNWIPFYGIYVRILKPVGVVLLVLGVWLRGGYDVEMAWRDKIAKLEEKVKIAEAESQKVNTEIVTKVVNQTKVVREKGDAIIQYIDREVVKDKEVIKFVESCPIPPVIINIINAAAKNQPIQLKMSPEMEVKK